MIVSRLATSPLPGAGGLPPAPGGRRDRGDRHGALGGRRGVRVPSRDRTEAKVTRKRTFLGGLAAALPTGKAGHRLVLGGFNILEPTHVPRYRTFQAWGYGFCTGLATAGYRDAFRLLAPDALECSWVGRTGDGYRYDHAHVSGPLTRHVTGCRNVHEPHTDGPHGKPCGPFRVIPYFADALVLVGRIPPPRWEMSGRQVGDDHGVVLQSGARKC
jgi:exodeoxyribonuclease-3